MRQKGFTVIELVVVTTFLIIAGSIFVVQRSDMVAAARDNERKTAINAMYYSLEEVYFAGNRSYPSSISSKVLPSVDPALFKDPNGIELGTAESNYHYEATGCNGGNICTGYTLRADLEKEPDFVKTTKKR